MNLNEVICIFCLGNTEQRAQCSHRAKLSGTAFSVNMVQATDGDTSCFFGTENQQYKVKVATFSSNLRDFQMSTHQTAAPMVPNI